MKLFQNKRKKTTPSANSSIDRAARVQKLSTLCSLFAAFSLVCIVIAAASLIGNSSALKDAQMNSTKVLVASQALKRGETLSSEKIKVQSIPKEYQSENVVNENQKDSVLGRTLTADISPGSQISTSMLSGQSPAITLAGTLSSGFLAVSVSVNATNGVSNLLVVGDKVQVFRTVDSDGGNTPSSLLFKDPVKVIALDGNLSTSTNSNQSYSQVVLEVTPEQAALISSSQAQAGSLVYLALTSNASAS